MDPSRTPSASPDTSRAIAYAIDRLHRELPAVLTYHNAAHTELDVLPAARRLGQLTGLSPDELGLLEVGAAFHDLGHVVQSPGHEAIGVDIATEILPRYGFTPPDIQRVASLILATRMPQSPNSQLEQLLADADLDSLGREDFLETSKALWQERTALGFTHRWPEWLELQLLFLRSHRYFTEAARQLRENGKQRNIALLETMIRTAT